ncbi:MAG: metallophosphoesterase [Flavobacteriales bacterium]|nr:metallophosphoesterase [Flavobacteriales bacterium]
MKKAIIHISDLHVTNHLDPNGYEKAKELNSFFNTDKNDEFGDAFLQSIIQHIKEEFSDTEFYLMVTGDISDSASRNEYIEAKRILNEFITSLKIDKRKTLILPGDHDVNWVDCAKALDDYGVQDKKAFEFHQEKFQKFTDFYNDFYSDEGIVFDPENAVSGKIDLTLNSLIIGLNSNFKIGAQSGEGYINLEKLKIELENIISENSDKQIFTAFHHNLEAKYENSAIGNWEKDNRNQVKEYLQSKDIKVLFYGNEHTSFSEEEDGVLFQSAVGTLSKKNSILSFKIYEIDESDGFIINNKLFNFQPQNSLTLLGDGYWSRIESSPQEKKCFVIIKPVEKNQPIIKQVQIVEYNHIELPSIQQIETTEYSTKLFNLVKEKKLFHSGHFHWSETSRAHNWIDVTKILNNFYDLVFAKNAILDLVERNIGKNFDFVIGLGIEGNILSTKTAINYEKPYSFLPYSYRYDGHNDFEREICFENDNKYKSVLVITDVVNDGRTIRKLIHKRAVDFFKTVEKIFVVSLFYTGNVLKPNTTILNLTQEQLTAKGILEEDHPESRISYYFVTAMKVEECPYKADYKTACLLMQNPELGCIHKFYDDEKVEKRKKLKINLQV